MNKTQFIFVLALLSVISIIFILASCAPQIDENTIISSKTDAQISRVEFEIYSSGGYNRAWKLHDLETGALCYGNVEGGIVCEFLEK